MCLYTIRTHVVVFFFVFFLSLFGRRFRFEGRGSLYFWEHTYSAPSAVIHLESVTAIMPSEIVLHCIEMHDAEGVAWCITPEGVDDDDFHAASSRWLATLSLYCSPSVRHVVDSMKGK